MAASVQQLAVSGSGGSESPGQWHNHLPQWIVENSVYQSFRSQLKNTLQTIVDRCDSPDVQGDLIGCFGGGDLIKACGIAKSTFWDHLHKLEQNGFVVNLSRGGTINGRNYGSVYGVPGQKGALDGRKIAREMRHWIKDVDGNRRLEVVRPGAQASLFVRTGGVRKPDRGCPESGQGLSEIRTLPSHIPSHNHTHVKNHGVLRQRGGGERLKRRHQELSVEHLTDTGKLEQLYFKAIQSGYTSQSEHSWIQFVSMAEHALRKAANPCAMFVSNVRNGRWDYITNQDEEAAMKRIRAYRDGEAM